MKINKYPAIEHTQKKDYNSLSVYLIVVFVVKQRVLDTKRQIQNWTAFEESRSSLIVFIDFFIDRQFNDGAIELVAKITVA